MSGSCWTPEAVAAAAKIVYEWDQSTTVPWSLTTEAARAMFREEARAALTAAEPFLREALAREVEAMAELDEDGFGWLLAPSVVARRLRAGVPAPEPTKGNTP